jgi:hypothetical protein
MEVLVGLGYKSVSLSSDKEGAKSIDAQSTITFMGGIRYFISKGKDVSPYVAGTLLYASGPTIKTEGASDLSYSFMQLAAVFGAQYNLAKNFGIFGHFGIRYDISSINNKPPTGQTWKEYTDKTSALVFGTSAIGAVFYFDL